MCFLLSLWNWKTSKGGKDGKVGVGLIILHMPSDNCYNAHVRGLLFKFVDFLYSRSELFDRVIKVI